jgi:cytochrome c
VETVCYFPVYHENEEGLMGVQIDPNWEKNKWIYLFYSVYEGPKQPVYVANGSYHQGRYNRLSRFVFDNKMLHLSTEKVLLTVPELIGCCHTGGSIDFDSKGNLFLSTGDNTNPFESDGFGPFDERPGRALWDAQHQ